MGSMADYAYSLAMRDTIQRMVREELDSQRPKYRYATVESIDRTNRRCNVIYNGETASVTVYMGAIQPSRVGQIVRVEGIGTDKFIVDVMGPTASSEFYADRIRFGSGDVDDTNLAGEGNHPVQVGPSTAVNIRFDNNEFWAINNGVKTSYGFNGSLFTFSDDVRISNMGTGSTAAATKSYVDNSAASVLAVAPAAGWALWNDNTYKNLMFVMTRENIVLFSGLMKFVSGTSLKICAVTGQWIPYSPASATDGPRHIYTGVVNEAPRAFAMYSDGLYLRGALPTASQYISVNGWYPGANWVP